MSWPLSSAWVRCLSFGLCAVSLAAPGRAGDGETYNLVVHVGNPVSSLSRRQVSEFFLGKRLRWPSGTKAMPVDQSAKAPVREAFTRDVHGRSLDAVISYWQQAIFSGRGVPPSAKSGDAEVVAYVKANPGGVGYVSPSADVGEVRILRLDP